VRSAPNTRLVFASCSRTTDRKVSIRNPIGRRGRISHGQIRSRLSIEFQIPAGFASIERNDRQIPAGTATRISLSLTILPHLIIRSNNRIYDDGSSRALDSSPSAQTTFPPPRPVHRVVQPKYLENLGSRNMISEAPRRAGLARGAAIAAGRSPSLDFSRDSDLAPRNMPHLGSPLSLRSIFL
jgi:hypothetical protein